jgi:hypothetical protein
MVKHNSAVLLRCISYIVSFNDMFLKHNVYYTGAVTEGKQTSNNFHRPTLHCHKKKCISEESTNTVK